jgi:hypothetical protein
MSHFAKVENGIVTQVLVVEPDFIATGHLGDPAAWVQTSYNTRGNVHYGPDGNPDDGEAIRGNFAGIGYTYNEEYDVFYAPQPYPSWRLQRSNWLWVPPTPYPTEGGPYTWNEETKSWDQVVTE